MGKRPGQTRHQDEINALLVEHARRGRTVVRLKGGDPFVFGRGGEEAEALLAAGIAFEVVPGVTSAFAAPAAAGVPVTHRGLSSSVTVVSGHVGDPDAPGGGGLGGAGPGRADARHPDGHGDAGRDRRAGWSRPGASRTRRCWWSHRGTTPAQASVRTTLAGLADVELGPPCTIVIGPVAALDLLDAGHGGPLAGTGSS